MPDAFICANDNIAAGLMDKAICFNPQITTVSHKREILAGHCMELFDKIWKGSRLSSATILNRKFPIRKAVAAQF